MTITVNILNNTRYDVFHIKKSFVYNSLILNQWQWNFDEGWI